MTMRRTALFVPASNAKAVAKCKALEADVVILDLEDAVAPSAKDEARRAACAAVGGGGFRAYEVVIRVNGRDTSWGSADLEAAMVAGADAILIPKVNGPADIVDCNRRLSSAPPRLQLWAMIETCRALPSIFDIAAQAASSRLAALVLGTNDLGAEMRARPGPGRAPFQPVMTNIVAAARANAITALDGVCNEFTDLSRLRAEAEQGREFGFDGKSVIHPNQLEICNAVFSPTEDELSWARSVVEAFDRPENAGQGAISVAGKLVERLHLEQARRTLEWQRRAGEGRSVGL